MPKNASCVVRYMLTRMPLTGGTAGLVVASRLSDADPNLSILVVEGGRNNYNDPEVLHPILFPAHVAPTSRRTLFYKGTKEPQLANREMITPSGGVLGGGSSINLVTYSRPQREDFEGWKTPGWSADDLIPYYKKVIRDNLHDTRKKRIISDGAADPRSNCSSRPTTVPGHRRLMETVGQSTSPEGHMPEA